MVVPEVTHDRGLWTVPNAISLARLACVPLFAWLLVGAGRPVAAAVLLGVLGASDWVDGWIARHFDQGSEVGKVLDPVADRVLLIAGAGILLLDRRVPAWVAAAVLVREAIISLATLGLAFARARRIDVQWVGKAGTLALMFALPGFLLLDLGSAGDWWRPPLAVATWAFTLGGLALSYYAAVRYVPLARDALGAGRDPADRGVGTR
jgi:cardiolipin synthase